MGVSGSPAFPLRSSSSIRGCSRGARALGLPGTQRGPRVGLAGAPASLPIRVRSGGCLPCQDRGPLSSLPGVPGQPWEAGGQEVTGGRALVAQAIPSQPQQQVQRYLLCPSGPRDSFRRGRGPRSPPGHPDPICSRSCALLGQPLRPAFFRCSHRRLPHSLTVAAGGRPSGPAVLLGCRCPEAAGPCSQGCAYYPTSEEGV